MRIYGLIALLGTVAVTGCNSTPSHNPPLKVAVNGKPLKVDYYYSLNPDCSSRGATTPRITEAPRHGTVEFREALDFPFFKRDSEQAHCNSKRVPVTSVVYTPSAGYTGPDSFQVYLVFASGNPHVVNYKVEAQ